MMGDPQSDPNDSANPAGEPAPQPASRSRGRIALQIAAALVLMVFFVARVLGGVSGFTSGGHTSSSTPSSSGHPSAPETAPARPVAPRVGALAPDFTFSAVYTETEVSLSSLRGHPVWINFWASWCSPCVEEMPDIQAVYDKHKGEGLLLIGLNQQEGAQKVKEFAEKGRYNWTFAVDWDDAIYQQYGVIGLPTSVFIDKSGVIRSLVYGQMTPRAMEESIQTIAGN